MRESPKASVVIPVYNRPLLAEKAIRSVLLNEPHVAEIIVVDDGSTDNTLAALQTLATSIPLLKVVTKPNGGAASARNFGARRAKSDWVAFLDSDDEWLRGKLAAQFEAISKHPQARLCATRYWGRSPDAPRLMPPVVGPLELLTTHLEQHFIASSTVLMQKTLFEELGGYDESLPSAEDVDFFLRAVRRAKPLIVMEPYANLFKQPDGLSNASRVKTAQAHRHAIERFLKSIENEPDAPPKSFTNKLLARWSARVARALAQDGRGQNALAELDSHAELHRFSVATRLRAWRIKRLARRSNQGA